MRGVANDGSRQCVSVTVEVMRLLGHSVTLSMVPLEAVGEREILGGEGR